MNIREAILKAADHIEAHPGDFRFMSTRVPDACGTPGCALGWIAHFLGRPDKIGLSYYSVSGFARNWLSLGDLGSAELHFYGRMDAIVGGEFAENWMYSPSVCAATLRKYADQYHPAPADLIPASVRDIFAEVTNV